MSAVVTKSQEDCLQWVQRVHTAQSTRSPEACEAARLRIETARQHEVSKRKCKAVKGHAVRSRALVGASLQQMASCSAPDEHMAVQARYQSAKDASYRHQEASISKASAAIAVENGYSARHTERAELLRSAEDSEDEAMVEAAGLVGAEDVTALTVVAAEGLSPAQDAPGVARDSKNTVEKLLSQFRVEPRDESECAAKFLLYEGYGSEVEKMRTTVFKFYEETKPTVPAVIATDMGKQITGIDTRESMGIPDDAREWFVFHMMRKAEHNNLKMAGILDGFEKKLEFLAANDQTECPVCLEAFGDAEHAPETLGCCHKVCNSCWSNWCSLMGQRAFCPLCRHEAFLGEVTSRIPGASPSVDEQD